VSLNSTTIHLFASALAKNEELSLMSPFLIAYIQSFHLFLEHATLVSNAGSLYQVFFAWNAYHLTFTNEALHIQMYGMYKVALLKLYVITTNTIYFRFRGPLTKWPWPCCLLALSLGILC
jgi:hypothetical protein